MGPFSPKGGSKHTPDGEFHLVTEDIEDDVVGGDGTFNDEGCNIRTPARTVAVLIVIGGFLSMISLFFVMIYESVAHMKDNWEDYIDGAQRVTNDTQIVISLISKQASPTM